MLVLSRKPNESLRIGDEIRVTVVAVQGQTVRIAVDAPHEISVYREELYQRIAEANREAQREALNFDDVWKPVSGDEHGAS